MGDFFSGVWSWATGSSVSAALARTALVGYASRLLAGNTNPSDNASTPPDPGVRLQLNPSTENQIPVLYGEAYFGGNITDAVLSNDYKKMTYCLTLCEVTGTLMSTNAASAYTFNNVYFNNNRVVFKSDGFTVDYTVDASGNQDISMRDLIKVYFYKGQTGIQPVGKSGTTPSSSSVMPNWTAITHPMTNLIYAIVEVTYNKDKNVSGLPDCTFNVTNSMTLTGDCLVDYMMNSQYGAGIDVSEIDGTFVDLNTYCAAGFTYTDANSQSQSGIIGINGLVDTTQAVLNNMEDMAKAASSWISYDIHLGKWIIVINKAGTSIASFTDGNIIGDISISGTSLTQLSNASDVKYQNTDILDKTDFVKIEIPSGSLFPNEPRSTLQVNLPYTNKQSVAMKIGLQSLKQARIDKIISFKADYSYINLRAGELIDITNSILGYTNKVFRIVTATEVESDVGDLQVEFKCLEYDASVYTYSIQEYTVTTDDGILSIGSIGKPNVPSVTKTEQANVPKILINAVVPSGIVDAMEYWLTFDTTVSNDANRTYIKIGQFSNTNGSSLSENQTVSYTYSGLAQSDFFIKVRGINNIVTGPFSNPTGLIAYVPVVVADTVSNNPVSVGGQLMTLGLLTLLNNMDKLFQGDSSSGSVFAKVFDTFKTVTGYDLVGNAENGTLVINQVPVDNPSCYLEFAADKYPADRSTSENPVSNTSGDRAKSTGSYYFTVVLTGAALSKGSGSAKLYKSDGTLVQTVSGSACTIDGNKVSIPFSSRTIGNDYYIIMDKNFVTDGTCVMRDITSPTTWNFHTADPQDAIEPTPTPPGSQPAIPCPPVKFVKVVSYLTSTYVAKNIAANILTTKLGKVEVSPDNLLVDLESNIGLKFNQPIILGNIGNIVINKGSLSTHQTINTAQNFVNNKVSELFWIEGDTLWLNPTSDFDKGTTYYVTMPAGIVKNACNTGFSEAISGSTTATWTTDPGPSAKAKLPESGKSINQAGVSLNFDRISPLNDGGSISIVDANNNVVKTIPGNSPSLSTKEG